MMPQETRLQLWKEVWAPDLITRGVPTTPGCDPLTMLTSDAHTAQMVREGLPGACVRGGGSWVVVHGMGSKGRLCRICPCTEMRSAYGWMNTTTADRISVENGAVISNCKRWPLIIDPQGQGIKWLRQKEAAHGLQVVQLSQKNWVKKLEKAISNGETVIIENVGEELDATLDPVLARAIYKKGACKDTCTHFTAMTPPHTAIVHAHPSHPFSYVAHAH